MPRVGSVYVSPHGPVPDLPGEEWRDWEDFWEVSNLGRFKAKERLVEQRRGVWRQRERLLTLHMNDRPGQRAPCLRFQSGGELRAVSLYRAMWEAFIGPVPEGSHIMCDGEIRLGNLTPKAGHPRGYA